MESLGGGIKELLFLYYLRFIVLIYAGSCDASLSSWPIFEKVIIKPQYEDYLRMVVALEIVKKDIM